ncbi:MAG: hypothetical protein KKD18_05680 [Nanoarchaeota archaeon]|nr:hypothetical protein [Nanoarchaeota archaeon]MBU0977880.1 hypothetical protein [Nanoarchaeota archaeon]
MAEIQIAYRPLRLPELREGDDPARHRISRSMLVEKMEAEASAAFLKNAVVSPFEEALKKSDREKFDTGEFVIEINEGGSGSTSWAGVYDELTTFLDVRADDSRAASFDGVKYFDGVGYCIRVEDLQKHVDKLVKDKTSEPSGARSLRWPAKDRGKELPTEITLPDGSFYRATRENGKAVLQAKRFISGVDAGVSKPYKAELVRWFNAVTGYEPPGKIPDRDLGHDERVVEFGRGSYGEVQLIRQETPDYKAAIAQVREALQDMKDMVAVKQFRSTNDADGTPYVNIKSLVKFFGDESLKDNNLIKVGSRYNITP